MTINDPKGIDNNEEILDTCISGPENQEVLKKIELQNIVIKTGEDKADRNFEEDSYTIRVNKIKKQIEAGEYKVSSARIAKKMIDNMEKQRGIDN